MMREARAAAALSAAAWLGACAHAAGPAGPVTPGGTAETDPQGAPEVQAVLDALKADLRQYQATYAAPSGATPGTCLTELYLVPTSVEVTLITSATQAVVGGGGVAIPVAAVSVLPSGSIERTATGVSQLDLVLDYDSRTVPPAPAGENPAGDPVRFPIASQLLALRRQLIGADHNPPCFVFAEAKDKLTFSFDALRSSSLGGGIAFTILNLSASRASGVEYKNTIVVNFRISRRPTLDVAKADTDGIAAVAAFAAMAAAPEPPKPPARDTHPGARRKARPPSAPAEIR